MASLDWNRWQLIDGILREPTFDARQCVLWLRGHRVGAIQHWKRVSNVLGPATTTEGGVCTAAATVVAAQQQLQGVVGKLLNRLLKKPTAPTWMLPSGGVAEQIGERETDAVFAWSDDPALPLDESRVRSSLPSCTGVQRLADGLFVAYGVKTAAEASANGPHAAAVTMIAPAPNVAPTPGPTAPTEDPRLLAEAFLASARRSGDRRKEAMALTDLGVMLARSNDANGAVESLQKALVIVREMGDVGRESDVLGNLSFLLLGSDAPKGLALARQALNLARKAGDRYEEKLAQDRLAKVYAEIGDRAQALDAYRYAIDLARELGDGAHEAELHWNVAMEYAELGVTAQADTAAQQAIAIFDSMGRPQGRFLAEHLDRFRQGVAHGQTDAAALQGVHFSAFMASGNSPRLMAKNAATDGPGLLRMGLSALKSMGRFIGSGLKTVSPEARQKRLDVCNSCEHHTGIRCRLCGCFTGAKTWLPFEDCPAGKWPR